MVFDSVSDESGKPPSKLKGSDFQIGAMNKPVEKYWAIQEKRLIANKAFWGKKKKVNTISYLKELLGVNQFIDIPLSNKELPSILTEELMNLLAVNAMLFYFGVTDPEVRDHFLKEKIEKLLFKGSQLLSHWEANRDHFVIAGKAIRPKIENQRRGWEEEYERRKQNPNLNLSTRKIAKFIQENPQLNPLKRNHEAIYRYLLKVYPKKSVKNMYNTYK